MHSRVIILACSVAVLLLMVSSSAIAADDQHYPRVGKMPGGAWLSAHQLQQLNKRGRFVFRDAPNVHHFDAADVDALINEDVHDAESNLNKRNWRL